MSPTFHFFYYALWFAHPLLQTVLAAVMLRRKLHRKFPVFFAYVLAEVVIFAIVFPASVKGSYRVFFYSYWLTAAISLALGFYVIHEIFLDIFRPYHTLKDLGTVLFKWAGLVMLLVAGVVAAANPEGQSGAIVQAVLIVQRCVRVIQCGLVLFLLLFSKYLGVSWKQKSFGISLGFGFFAAVELFVGAFLASGHANDVWLPIVNMIAYNLSIGTWIGYAWAKDYARDSSAMLLQSQRWDQSFMDLQHPMPADSLIPMFETMVEQAISEVKDGQRSPSEDGVQELTLQEMLDASLPGPAKKNTKLANSAAASGSTQSKS